MSALFRAVVRDRLTGCPTAYSVSSRTIQCSQRPGRAENALSLMRCTGETGSMSFTSSRNQFLAVFGAILNSCPDYRPATLINKSRFIRLQPHRVGWELQPPGWDAHQVVSVASATSSHPRFRPKAVVGAYCVYAYALYGTVLLFTDSLILYEISSVRLN